MKRDYLNTLGASEIADVVGYGYKTALEAAQRKLSGRWEPPNPNMVRGSCMEHGLIRWWCALNGEKYADASTQVDVMHPNGWAAATLDYLSAGRVAVETKCPGSFAAWNERTGKHPYGYHLQSQWQVGVCRAAGRHVERGELAAGPKDGKLICFHIAFDASLFASLLKCGGEYMGLIRAGQLPTPAHELRWHSEVSQHDSRPRLADEAS